MGDHCHLGVGHHHPHALQGCAGGGTHHLLLFQRDGLSIVVGVCVVGGFLLPVGACCSWVHGWGIIVVGRVSLSVCACGRCWWWCSLPVVIEHGVSA